MNSILLLVVASQLPFTSTATGPSSGPALQAEIASAVSASDAQFQANDERLRQLFANTKSVMKRPGNTASGDGPQTSGDNGPAGMRDDQIIQLTYNQAQKDATQDPKGGAARTGEENAAASTPRENNSRTTQPPIPDSTRSAANLSAALLSRALALPEKNALAGRPLSLPEALGRAPSSSQRLEIASLYWKLALALADYHWALDESLQLDALPDYQGLIDSPLLAAAQAAAQARTLEAKAAAVTAQQELADALGQPTQELPLTVEQPLVGPYRTEFDSIFANRAAPGRARAIHRALPHWREAIDLRSAAVQAARSAIAPAEEPYAKQKAGIETALYVHRELAQQRRAFLNAVRQYNAEIVEYASYVAGPTTSVATLVSMLTRSKPPETSGGSTAGHVAATGEPTVAPPEDSGVRQVSGEQPLRDDEGWQGANGTKTEPPMY